MERSLELRLARRLARRGRALAPTPIAACADAAIVRIVGAVGTEGPPMFAPISRRPCVYWRLAIWLLESSGRRIYWRELAARTRHAAFVLADPSGTCRVDPGRATIRIDGATVKQLRRGKRWPRAVLDLFDGDDRIARATRDRPIQISETIVGCGDRVAVIGAGPVFGTTCLITNDPALLRTSGGDDRLRSVMMVTLFGAIAGVTAAFVASC